MKHPIHEICSAKLTSNNEEETLAIVDIGLVITEVVIHRTYDTREKKRHEDPDDKRRLIANLLGKASPGQQLEVLQ